MAAMNSLDLSRAAWRKSTYSNNGGACIEVAQWRKASHSNNGGSCIEVGQWQKSSHSNSGGNCIEVTDDRWVIAVRDSKDPAGPKLAFAPASWTAFTAKLKARPAI